MAAARRRRLSAGTASLLLALLVLLPVAAAMPAVAAPEDPDDEGTTRLTITSITTVVDEDERARVVGRLSNTGDATLEEPRVSLVPSPARAGRAGITTWSEGTEPVTGTAADSATLPDVPAGGSAPFALEVDGEDLLVDGPAGAARVSIQTDSQAVHTFIGVHRRKEYVPLRVVWGIPLLLPADERLWRTGGSERTAAWQEAVGEDSRIGQLTEESPASDEVWLLDPSLLDVPKVADDGRIEQAERTIRRDRAAALRQRVVGDRTLVLPGADADVDAGTRSAAGRDLVGRRVAEGVRVAEELGARSDVLWPAEGVVTDRRASALDRIHPGETTLLTPSTSLDPESFTPTGGARTDGGTPLIVRDGPLSDIVEGLGGPEDLVLARQQLVAESAALLSERAGTERTVLIVPDRDASPDPATWEQLRDSTERIPWLADGDLASVLEDSAAAQPEYTPRDLGAIRRSIPHDPPAPAALTPDRAKRLLVAQREMFTFASVRSDGPQWRREILPSLHQLTSTRWRQDQSAWVRQSVALGDEVVLAQDDLEVSSGDVNFFADTGRLQITVVNTTDVELSHLVVRLVPDNPSLRIDDQPEPVTIGPGGRQTVTVQATALAAGQVPVHVSVATPGGEQLAVPATLRVRVRPTGDSIYWVIGGAAVLLVLAGTWRTVRGGRRADGAADDTRDDEGHA